MISFHFYYLDLIVVHFSVVLSFLAQAYHYYRCYLFVLEKCHSLTIITCMQKKQAIRAFYYDFLCV